MIQLEQRLSTGLLLLILMIAGGCSPITQTPTTSSAVSGEAEAPEQTEAREQIRPPTSTSAGTSTSTEIEVGSRRMRMADNRPPVDDQRVRATGLLRLESRRLVLLTDLPIAEAEHLPTLTDQLFEELEQRLGSLPPAADGSDFQVTGCLMNARERFLEAGLLPELDLVIRHGRHLDYRFWMFNPPSDYYRKHLLLHEFVHCFMTCEFGMQDLPPLWYTEGIAEYFATHQWSGSSGDQAKFGVLPDNVESFSGWGRIAEVRRSFRSQPSLIPLDAGFTSLDSVLFPAANAYTEDSQYALAWMLYWLLSSHPSYQDSFSPFLPVRSRGQFNAAVSDFPAAAWERLAVDWLLTMDSLTQGFDITRAFPVHRESPVHRETGPVLLETSLEVFANSEWQDSGCSVRAGQHVRITAEGQFVLAEEPHPWVSEPQGITIDYHRGRPLGELLGILVAHDGSRATQRIPLGNEAVIDVPFDSRLWLQLNDSAASRNDNSGTAVVRISVR